MTDRTPALGAMEVFAEGFIEESLEEGVSYFDIPDYAAEEAGEGSDLHKNVKYYINNPDETELEEMVGAKALNEFKEDRETVSEMWSDFNDEEEHYIEKYGHEATTWIPEWIENFDECPNCEADLFMDQSEQETYCPFCT